MRVGTRSTGWLLLGVLGTLAMVQAAAQSTTPTQSAGDRDTAVFGGERTSDSADSPGTTRSSVVRHLFDDFSAPVLQRKIWEHAVGAVPVREPDVDGRFVSAVRLGLDRSRRGRTSEIRSVAIDLAGLSGAELSYTVRHRGADAGLRLSVECLLKNGDWQTLERVVADGSNLAEFARHTCLLPAEALHSKSQVRFRATAVDADDAWFLGDVVVAENASSGTLTVSLNPARNATVELILEDLGDRSIGVTPFTRALPVDSRVILVAPPEVAERVFSHWTVGGAPGEIRQRVLAVEVKAGVEVVAHYRAWGRGRAPASVAIVAVPDSGVRVALGCDSEQPYTQVRAQTEYRCLTGEWLTLRAPPRTPRLVFVGWVVNGEALPSGDNLLEHRVTGDDVLLAEYVLLGDMNGDGTLDKFDVEEFVAALIDPAGYAERYPNLERMRRGDVNGDGEFDALDVEQFVDLLLDE